MVQQNRSSCAVGDTTSLIITCKDGGSAAVGSIQCQNETCGNRYVAMIIFGNEGDSIWERLSTPLTGRVPMGLNFVNVYAHILFDV